MSGNVFVPVELVREAHRLLSGGTVDMDEVEAVRATLAAILSKLCPTCDGAKMGQHVWTQADADRHAEALRDPYRVAFLGPGYKVGEVLLVQCPTCHGSGTVR